MKITEMTLEKEVTRLLEQQLNGQALTQVISGRKRPDIILTVGEYKFVIELELGPPRKMLEAVTQGYEYAQLVGADGMIGLVYPETARRVVASQQDVIDIVTATPVSVLILSPLVSQHYAGITLGEFAKRFGEFLTQRAPTTDVGLITNVLREAVELISLMLRRRRGVNQPVLTSVVARFDLFEALSADDPSQARGPKRDFTIATCDLAAYVLVNQILLYHLLSKPLKLPALPLVDNLEELKRHFEKVMKVDYRAVYGVDVVSDLPARSVVQIKKIITALRAINPENIPHDLLGRIFHEFLPFETRKLLATFYTRPIAAELLAGLALETGREIVVDPACGSGTLLVSAYRQKRRLDPTRKHRRVLEKEIYGVDIMPFAAHLAALNLTLQDLSEVTNVVNIGLGNALDMGPSSEVKMKLPLFAMAHTGVTANERDASVGFELPKQADVVLMNPPYTDRKRLQASMLGGQADAFIQPQNYWAYFLKLADSLLSAEGRIAAVLPRLTVAGSFSREVREWLFKQGRYTLRYIVRTSREIAFSEAASFRDYLLVMDKGFSDKPCAIVYLKASLRELSLTEAQEVAQQVRRVKPNRAYRDANVEVAWASQKAVRSNWANLGFLVSFENAGNARLLSGFYDALLERANGRLTKLGAVPFVKVRRGFEPKPAGLYDAVFLVRDLNPKRLGHSKLIITKETKTTISATWKNTPQVITVPLQAVTPALKTASYVGQWKADAVADRVITRRFDGFKNGIEKIFGKTIDFGYVDEFTRTRLTHLLVVKRVDLAAPGTSALAFYAETRMVSANVMYSVMASPSYSKALCLWLNSICGVLQYLTGRMETHGAFCDLLQETLLEFWVPSPDFVKQHQAVFDRLMAQYGEQPLPALMEQFAQPSKPRKALDTAMLKLMGWEENEIEQMLPDIYHALASELQLMVSAMSETAVVESAKDKTADLELD